MVPRAALHLLREGHIAGIGTMTESEKDTVMLVVTELIEMVIEESRSETELNAAFAQVMNELVERYHDFPSQLLFYCIGRGVGIWESRRSMARARREAHKDDAADSQTSTSNPKKPGESNERRDIAP